MKLQHLIFTLDLPGIPVQRLRDFHSSPEAIRILTPPGTLRNLTGDMGPLHEGQELTLYVKKMGITLPWRARNESLSPEGFTDRMISGPFKAWIHKHHFVDLGQYGCQLVDEITFDLPLRPFSNLAIPLIIRDIKSLFKYRHQSTYQYLQTKKK